jgi:hypothetical protein
MKALINTYKTFWYNIWYDQNKEEYILLKLYTQLIQGGFRDEMSPVKYKQCTTK